MNIQELWILMVLINMKMQMYTWDSQTPLWVDSGWWSMTPLPAKLLVASHTSNWWHSHSAYQGTDCKMEQPTCQSKQLLNKKLCSLSLSLSAQLQKLNNVYVLPGREFQKTVHWLQTHHNMQITLHSGDEEFHWIHRQTGELSLHGWTNGLKDCEKKCIIFKKALTYLQALIIKVLSLVKKL